MAKSMSGGAQSTYVSTPPRTTNSMLPQTTTPQITTRPEYGMNSLTTNPPEIKIGVVSIPPGEKTILFARCFTGTIAYVFKTIDPSILPPTPPVGSSSTGWINVGTDPATGERTYHIASTNPCQTAPPPTTNPQTTNPQTTNPQTTTQAGFQNMSEGFTTSAPPQNFNNAVVPGRSLVEITTPLSPTKKPTPEPTSKPYLWSNFTAFVDTVFSGNQLSSQPTYSATPVPPSIEAMVSNPTQDPTSSYSSVDILREMIGATTQEEIDAMRAYKDVPSLPEGKNEVYHVAGNNFTYPEAQAVCRAFGAKLATYEQIEEAYNDGADWINYGWSEGQYAYFPLQKETWQGIQDAIKANGGQCPNKMLANVRPGISGGYFANPNVRFGVNCYGVKPPQRASDNMGGVQIPTIPSLPDPVEQLAQTYQKNLDQLKIDSFDANKWSEYK